MDDQVIFPIMWIEPFHQQCLQPIALISYNALGVPASLDWFTINRNFYFDDDDGDGGGGGDDDDGDEDVAQPHNDCPDTTILLQNDGDDDLASTFPMLIILLCNNDSHFAQKHLTSHKTSLMDMMMKLSNPYLVMTLVMVTQRFALCCLSLYTIIHS